jgi:hypothetical protein
LTSSAAEILTQHDAVLISQQPVTTNQCSTPVTYTGIAPASLFSANSGGACPDCHGLGVIHTDLAFVEGQQTVCQI